MDELNQGIFFSKNQGTFSIFEKGQGRHSSSLHSNSWPQICFMSKLKSVDIYVQINWTIWF